MATLKITSFPVQPVSAAVRASGSAGKGTDHTRASTHDAVSSIFGQ